jgi:hypothetical protein
MECRQTKGAFAPVSAAVAGGVAGKERELKRRASREHRAR